MQRQRGELVPIGDALADLGGPVKGLGRRPSVAVGWLKCRLIILCEHDRRPAAHHRRHRDA